MTSAQKTSAVPDQLIYVRCGTLIDGTASLPRSNVTVMVKNDRIAEIRDGITDAAQSAVVDLSHQTCLPGLIDTHTHVLLQGDITAADYDEQLLKQSSEYRAILATVNARRALEYGFTTIRDVETEGAGYADVDVKNAINNGVIPGPRMQVATRAMDVTGAYPLLGYAPSVEVPHGVQVVDGPDQARKTVREQISHGADWIKVYSDRSYKVREDGVLDDIPTFTPEELKAIVDEAHRERRKVASHAMALQGVHNSVEAGVDSIEHGNYIADQDLKTMVARGIFYVPTIYVGAYVAEGRAAERSPGVGEDVGDSRGHLSPRNAGTRENCFWYGRWWICVDRKSGQGVCLHGQVGNDARTGDPFGNRLGSGLTRLVQSSGDDRGRQVR